MIYTDRKTHPIAQLVHRDRKRVHICLETIALAAGKLRRLIQKGSLDGHRRVYVCDARDAKICDLGGLCLASNQNVARLDVTMDDAYRVEIEDTGRAFLLV